MTAKPESSLVKRRRRTTTSSENGEPGSPSNGAVMGSTMPSDPDIGPAKFPVPICL